MEPLEQFSKRIEANLQGWYSDSSPTERAAYIMQCISYYLDDALKLIKNINDTSLPGTDRTNRIIEMETKFGIPKTHVL